MEQKEINIATQSVRVRVETIGNLKQLKIVLGLSMSRFIEDAVAEKIQRLPKKQKEKLGVV